MTTFLAIMLAKLIDPISIIIVTVTCLTTKNKWIIPAAAVIASVVVETILTMNVITKEWGSGIIYGFIASAIHASVAYYIIRRMKSQKQ